MNSIIPFILYVVIATYTPGPNNITSMSLASAGGIKESFIYGFGVVVGSAILLVLSIVISKTLFGIIPVIKPYIVIFGMAYMLYLAFKIFKSGDLSSKEDSKASFIAGILMQFVNAKGIIFCITTMSVYAVPYYDNNISIFFIIFLIELVVLSSIILWGLFGTIFYKLFSSKYKKIINTIMAILLVYCAFSLLF